MARADSLESDKDEEEGHAAAQLAESPIRLLLYYHTALREEIAELKRLAVAASESGDYGGSELILDLRRRFEFLKLACMYHSASEDEIIFLALDAHSKNIVLTYSLEHDSTDDHFDSIFHWFNESSFQPLQELVSYIDVMQSFICKHMLKEEEQVFPLLIEKFSLVEQASLVWQFLCIIPAILLVDLLPWMISFLCPKKQEDLTHCLGQVMPKETLLEEVIISWLQKKEQSPISIFTKIGEKVPDASVNTNIFLQLHSAKEPCNCQGKETLCVPISPGNTLVGYLHLWHSAILKDLNGLLEESHQIRSSSRFSDIDPVVARIKFVASVVIFYSEALKKFFYPLLSELANKGSSPTCDEQSLVEGDIASLHQLLYCHAQNNLPLSKFVEKLCQRLEAFVVDISKQFQFQETEVFPVIYKNCSSDTQLQLLYLSFHMMPLGLLKCAITWFATHLSTIEAKSIVHSVSQIELFATESFASLLSEWFRIGCLGKTSVEKFGEDLLKLFKTRWSFLPEKFKEAFRCSSQPSDMQPCKESNPDETDPDDKDNFLSHLSSSSQKENTHETSYSSEMNMHVFFSVTTRTMHPYPKLLGEEKSASSTINDPIPMDIIFFFHKALRKDLEHLVSSSALLVKNVGLLADFCEHFRLLHFRYQFHSKTEDEIVFPALEAKEKIQNVSHSYTIDHKLQVKCFTDIAFILDELSKLNISVSSIYPNMPDERMMKYNKLCVKLHCLCKSMHILLSDHALREEIELWPLFRECFSIQEQEKIIACMLGRISAETLQDIIIWLFGSLSPEEQKAVMTLWRKVTKNTMFDQWLEEWWEGNDIIRAVEKLNTSCSADPLEIVSGYLAQEALDDRQCNIPGGTGIESLQKECFGSSTETSGQCDFDNDKIYYGDEGNDESSKRTKLPTEGDKKTSNNADEVEDVIEKPGKPLQLIPTSKYHEQLLTMSQEDLEAAIRRVSRDSSLDPQKKSYIIQNLLTSRWMVRQQMSHTELKTSSNGENVPGQHPSYRDPLKLIFGCKHYKRNCKLLTPCCNQLYTCIRCHDEEADHSTDRRAITKMMCMKCLVVQPIQQACSAVSCNNLSMGRYYCKICKLFDDEREIYHCPYCNLCRVGKGLGVDYFHCMNCNACMSWSLNVHTCREKCLEENCPICNEYIFTSSNPVKALPCGHLMHSTCFRDYTCTHYTCPICGKSLGDMQAYFQMLDALLAKEKIPEEYSGQTQAILCNDCEKKGAASFHWLHHKCPYCGSYNTRLL